MNFEEQMAETIRQSVIKEIKTTSFLKLGYNDRSILPSGVMDNLWDSINWEEVIAEIRPTIQTRICNTIVGSMETELKTDIKKLLSVSGVREKLRLEIYPKLMKVLDGE